MKEKCVLVYIFKADGRVFGVTQDAAGTNLPTGLGAWSGFKSLELNKGVKQPGVDVDECLDDIEKYGFHVTDAHERITQRFV